MHLGAPLHSTHQKPASSRRGFTIVELLIVIVVIGILAAITIVAFNGVQNKAKQSSAQSALAQASKKIAAYAALNTDQLPADTSELGLTNNGGLSYQYSVNNNANPRTYCLTATIDTTNFFQNNTTRLAPTTGACPGHGQNGVPAVTNLVKNPKGIGASTSVGESTGWFTTGGNTNTPGVSWNSRSDWHRFNGTSGNRRLYLDQSTLENGQAYTVSILVGNSGTVTRTFGIDFCDQGAMTVTVEPGEMKRVSLTAARGTYDSIYRFVDFGMGTNSDGILVTEAMVAKGSTLYPFADGNSTDWVWNGAVNNSTSTGPVL